MGEIEVSAGLTGLKLALSGFRGAAMEKSWTLKSSTEVKDGRPHLSVEQMKVDTGDVLNRLLAAIQESGWSVRYGLFTPRWLKVVALILAALFLTGSALFTLVK